MSSVELFLFRNARRAMLCSETVEHSKTWLASFVYSYDDVFRDFVFIVATTESHYTALARISFASEKLQQSTLKNIRLLQLYVDEQNEHRWTHVDCSATSQSELFQQITSSFVAQNETTHGEQK